MTDTEAQLWEAFQNGNKNAFEELLRIFYRPMFDFGYQFQKDHDSLSDDIHDLFVSLWDRRSFLKPTDNLKVYLFSALRNQIFRSKKKRHLTEEFSDEEAESAYYQTEYVETEMIRMENVDEQLSRISYVMQKLTPRQQEILHLRFFENLSNEQISRVLGISEPSVYNLLSISLKLFRKYWKQYFAAFSIILLPIKILIFN
jgi:RNA polymerase sigma factor (sigma-70 family)